ncbi:MAG: glycosyl transferase family 1 [Bacteroidetes bacterium HGW-Bacteroidetes-21]|jgi:glycosyltransferase involved in cell wall biosynthesis|nr:MAG: glycosyl transferase family 1 [Bacteroidetes bacterium HGW-Bacteroidetes-21]
MEKAVDKKVLFVANQELNCAPNQRFRFEQYLYFFTQMGFQWEISHLLSCKDVQKLYTPGHYIRKAKILKNSIIIRRNDIKRLKNFDLIYVSREALMTGSVFFEKKLHESGIPFIFDFDDAIWRENVSPANRKFKWLKKPSKTADIIRMASLVIAGNNYLAEYARKFNSNVKIIPTTVDTDKFVNLKTKSNKKIVIGWSGSKTTIAHFETIIPVLDFINDKYPKKVEFRVIGDDSYTNKRLNIKGIKWTAHDEVEKLNEFDIGIMPLPHDEWSLGKCGLKGLTYMSCEIPSVFSAVGVNNEIITQGQNGFVATTSHDWIQCLSELIENTDLRNKIGIAGRKTVVEKYSVIANKEKYLEAFNSVLKVGS